MALIGEYSYQENDIIEADGWFTELGYHSTLNQEQVFGDPVTSDDLGDEIDLTVEWTATDSIVVIGVLDSGRRGQAVDRRFTSFSQALWWYACSAASREVYV